MHAPTAEDLLNNLVVQHALEEAWHDSKPGSPMDRHEEGGWFYCDLTSGTIQYERAAGGGKAHLDLSNPPVVAGSVVVATYHTHPNPSSEDWNPAPSEADEESAWTFGVPCLVRADDGVHVAGPSARRGGLSGNPGFPNE